jgi:hypothetical protein
MRSTSFGSYGKAPLGAFGATAPLSSAYVRVGTFIDTNRDYAYYVFQSPYNESQGGPVYFQIVQGPPGTTLGKTVPSTGATSAAWTSIRNQYDRVQHKTNAKGYRADALVSNQTLPMRYVNRGEAGTTSAAPTMPPPQQQITGGGTLPGLGTGGGVGMTVPTGYVPPPGGQEAPSGPGIGSVIGVGAAVTVSVLALYWAFGRS